MEPFTPAIFGSKRIANFTTSSYPQAGTLWMGVFGGGLLVVLVWNWRGALRERAHQPAR